MSKIYPYSDGWLHKTISKYINLRERELDNNGLYNWDEITNYVLSSLKPEDITMENCKNEHEYEKDDFILLDIVIMYINKNTIDSYIKSAMQK